MKKTKNRRHRRKMKGNVEDIVVITVFAIITAIVAMLMYLVVGNFAADPSIASQPVAVDILNQGLVSFQVLGNSIIFITIAFGLASAISAFFTDTHPVFFIFSIITFSICMIVVVIFSQFFIDLAATEQLLPIASNFAVMIETIRNFPIVGAVIGALIIIALYAKRSDLNQGGGMA